MWGASILAVGGWGAIIWCSGGADKKGLGVIMAYRGGNLNPRGNIVGLANWCPYSTMGTKVVSATAMSSFGVPSQARAVLLTADVDMMVGLSTNTLTASQGIRVNAGEPWPATVLPRSTAAFRIRGTGTKGLATFQFLTHRSLA